MGEMIRFTAEIVNTFHDILQELFKGFGFQLNDKELHFWIFGVLGIIFFLFIHVLFKWISTLSITGISFLYTFTVLVVIVFAIEIQQKITGRGNMEFADAIIGLWGFIAFFAFYLFFRLLFYFFFSFNKKRKKSTKYRT
ncbi:hypothetical protein [Fictibacillus arsenicus]|uniref:Uncharacterized protein n=1 Tax=Fictibacillus arsenicus TaxID=255247 RepID=A0A1V3GC34_9BACL|nr:hypothetical protein [Fictibacillus arsenicus]OOE14436.1 hypothetical protein UN64_04380 [Fictibacillus arsenicus]